MNAILSAHKLRKSYGGQVVVDGLDLSIRRGECFGLLGPNGAGKTTTLRLMLGLIAPDSGELQLLGHAVPQQARAARMRVGVVPQIDNLDPDFTGWCTAATSASATQRSMRACRNCWNSPT
jgi:lipooligosaccharide transport system ATP-binding protein